METIATAEASDPSAGPLGPQAEEVSSPPWVEKADSINITNPQTLDSETTPSQTLDERTHTQVQVETRTLTLVPSEPGAREPRDSGPPPISRFDNIGVSCSDYPPVCDDSDRQHVVCSMANPFDKPSWPSAFQPYSRSPGMPNMETRSHYFPPVVGDSIGESRYMTHGSRPPSRHRSHASSRASSRLSGVDMSWLGPYMTKLADGTNVREKRMSDEAIELVKRMSEEAKRMADEANEREKRMLDEAKRLADEANLREQRMLEESDTNLELMKELLPERESAALAREQINHEREQQHQTLASRREEIIRQDMRQYAAVEARAADLQEKLRAEQLKPTTLATVDTLWPTERTTSRASLDTDPCVSLSSQGVYPMAPPTTADLSR